MEKIKEECNCQEIKNKLEECKERKHKDCEEFSKEQSKKIVLLEKKIMTMTIVGVIAITLIGKELTDKIINAFSTVETIQQRIGDASDLKSFKNDDSNAVNDGDPFPE
jgi:hypothetical protein